MANGMTAFMAAIAVASAAPVAAGPAQGGGSWEARNRERARAGLLPRKLPAPRSKFSTVRAGPPTAVPTGGEAVATPRLAASPPATPPATPPPTALATATPTPTSTPTATATATATSTPPATPPPTPLATATTTPSAPASPLQVSLVPSTPSRLIAAQGDVRGDVEEPRVDSVLVTKMGDARLVVRRPSAPPAAALEPVARPRHPPGLLSRTWTAGGDQVHRVVDPDGRISERHVDARGLVVEAHVIGDAAELPLVWQKRRADGNVVQVVEDAASGALIALTRDGGGHLLDARVHPRDGVEG